jgi:hypothetical protein
MLDRKGSRIFAIVTFAVLALMSLPAYAGVQSWGQSLIKELLVVIGVYFGLPLVGLGVVALIATRVRGDRPELVVTLTVLGVLNLAFAAVLYLLTTAPAAIVMACAAAGSVCLWESIVRRDNQLAGEI